MYSLQQTKQDSSIYLRAFMQTLETIDVKSHHLMDASGAMIARGKSIPAEYHFGPLLQVGPGRSLREK
jgi:hypothetical protein